MRRVDTSAQVARFAALALALAAGCSTTVDSDQEDGSTIADPLDDGYDECAVRDWYGDGQCDTGCLDPDPDCISAQCDDACADYCDASWTGGDLPALPADCTAEMCDCGEPPVECPDLCASQCFGEPLPDEIPPECPSFTCDCAEVAWEPDESGIVPVAATQQRCGQESPDADTMAELDAKDRAGAFLAMASSVQSKRTIPIAIHVIRARGGGGDVGRSRLIRQLRVMNRSFSRSPFKFKIKKITRTTNNTWFRMSQGSSAESKAKSRLHSGGMATLNLYTVGFEQYAWATFPWRREGDKDGVVVPHSSLPGGNLAPFNLGDTAVHETGHWVGLFHTFQNGCSSPGDAVADTPAEAGAAEGCPVGRDTCRAKGKDPVKNFMNYSDDSCMNTFTAGQRARMGRWVRWYRPAGGSRDLDEPDGCGDGQCTGDETDASCPADCGCAAVACDGVSPFGCYCDASCESTGDCCADANVCQ